MSSWRPKPRRQRSEATLSDKTVTPPEGAQPDYSHVRSHTTSETQEGIAQPTPTRTVIPPLPVAFRKLASRNPTSPSPGPSSRKASAAFVEDTVIYAETPMVLSPTPTNADFTQGQQDAMNTINDSKALQPGGIQRRRAPTEGRSKSGHRKNPSASSNASAISQGRLRWNTVRSHVVPGSAGGSPDSTPASSPSPFVQQFSQVLSSPSSASRGGAAPASKATRFQKLGFRQVAEQVIRDDVANEAIQKFARDIMRACVLARFSEVKKHEKDVMANLLASTSHFMSSLGSLATTTAFDVTASSSKVLPMKYGLRRPSSMQTLTKASHPVPSLKALHQLILYNAPAAATVRREDQVSILPMERDVLSALLFPFLDVKYGQDNEAERQLAIETFQIIVKTWAGSNERLELDRVMWCCKAASAASPSDFPRFLSVLNFTLSLPDRIFASKPAVLQSLVIALFSLLHTSRHTPVTMDFLKSLIKQVMDGRAGELDGPAVEGEYAVTVTNYDNPVDTRALVVLEGLTMAIELSSFSVRWWLLIHVLSEYWSLGAINNTNNSPLQAALHTRKVSSFLRACSSLLSHSPPGLEAAVGGPDTIWDHLQSRALPELVVLGSPESTMQLALKVVMGLLLYESTIDRALAFVVDVSSDPVWKSPLEKELVRMIKEGSWDVLIRTLVVLLSGMNGNKVRDAVSTIIVTLCERLVDDPPPETMPSLTNLLDLTARLHPQIFYKPVFLCAASVKDLVIANHLTTFASIARFLPDFWLRDAEMMAIALLNDVGAKGKTSTQSAAEVGWSKARLGQSVLFVELVDKLRGLRLAKGEASTGDPSYSTVTKFVSALEVRLAVAIDAKEKASLLPFSQRKLVCALLLEIRLFTRSLKPAPWLRRVVSWATSAHIGVQIDQSNVVVNEGQLAECITITAKLKLVYETTRDASRSTNKQRSTVMFSPTNTSFLNGKAELLSSVFATRLATLTTLALPFLPYALELIVAVNALLSRDDFTRLGPYLWKSCLDGEVVRTAVSASFLIMQFGEKSPEVLRSMVIDELTNADVLCRRQAVNRLSILMGCRLQLLSQTYITDRAHRRPFKLARPPITYVATDVGSSQFVPDTESVQAQGTIGTLPPELRKQLIEVGWAQEDEPIMELEKWVRTPMSLLPNVHYERAGDGRGDQSPSPSPSPSPNTSPQVSPQKSGGSRAGDSGLQRKASTSGLQSIRRRPVVVPAVLAVLPRLAMLVSDPDFVLSQTAREVAMDFMRDDPGLICRPIFDSLSDASIDMADASTALRAFLHVRSMLPPALSHHIFNNLAGYLKYCARESEDVEVLQDFAYSSPILADLATQVSEMSVRQLRRAKVEAFLMPAGSLWFSDSAPPGPMFPRSLGQDISDHSKLLPARLTHMIMIRMSQHRFFMSILKQHPQEVQLIRHNLMKFALPTDDGTEYRLLELADFVPHPFDPVKAPDFHDRAITQLSLSLARSYLLLLVQVFRSMSRHLNDRNELAGMLDGINRILVTHGNDIGIVSHALLAFITASTRFKRLITAGGGYALFMPSVIKVYSEAEKHAGIRAAVEYAAERFYALHEDVFVFQTLDVMSHVLTRPGADANWIAKHLFTLIYSLSNPKGTMAPDAAGIHDLTKMQEREAQLASTVEEKPAMLATFRSKGVTAQDVSQFMLGIDREVKRLQPENIVKLILTVIAHDPGTQRSERMLHLLRWLTPHIFDIVTMRNILNDGIDALGKIFVSRAVGSTINGKTKQEGSPSVPPEVTKLEASSMTDAVLETIEAPSSSSSLATSDNNAVRQDFLQTVIAYMRVGGRLSPATMHRLLDLIKFMLKDDSLTLRNHISKLLGQIVQHVWLGEPAPSPKAVIMLLREIAPVLKSYAFDVHLDFAPTFQVLASLCANPALTSEQTFSALVVTQICGPALEHLQEAAAAQMLFASVSRRSIISLIVRAVPLLGADVLGELERQQATPGFLAGVVFPIVLSLKTSDQVIGEMLKRDSRSGDIYVKAWGRLLVYAMEACVKQPPVARRSGSIRGGLSEEKRAEKIAEIPVMTIGLAIQIIKIIITRAEKDLTRSIPGVWMRIAAFLRTLLEDGDAAFALQPADLFAPPSPSFSSDGFESPRRPSLDHDDAFLGLHSPRSPSARPKQPIASPRLVDYLMWSLLEFLHRRRSPLLLQLRLFVQEKVVALDEQLRLQGEKLPQRRSRRVSSVFVKPRRSGAYSMASTPDATPRLSAIDHVPGSPTKLMLTPPSIHVRQPGYNISSNPSSPTLHRTLGGSKIVHLGPSSHPPHTLFPMPSSPTRGAFSTTTILGQSKTLRSQVLARHTYRRVRLVQLLNGYELFLPFDEEGEFVQMQSWSRQQSIAAIEEETRDLLAEFSDDFYVGDMDVVF